MKKIVAVLLFLNILIATRSYSTTWDEPWAEKVIKEASSFILGKVISSDPDKGLQVLVIRTVSGKTLNDTIQISGFYLLKMCSSSGGHGAEFNTIPMDSCYLFIQQNSEGKFCIATPTSGFDYVRDGNVAATFRHSYHQASVPVAIYEKIMTAVFNNYHNLPYDSTYIRKFVNDMLGKSPSGFNENEIGTFFLQHVALECVYHLKLPVEVSLVLPFLNDKNNFHNQVSGARAMSAIDTESSKRELLKAIGDTTKRDFARVMCVWSLAELRPARYKMQLRSLQRSATDERDGFDSNIMDPRVCTVVPSLKEALETLVSSL